MARDIGEEQAGSSMQCITTSKSWRMSALVRSTLDVEWTSKHSESLAKLKHLLVYTPVLSYFDCKKNIVI